MKKLIIFGAGGTGRRVFNLLKNEYEVLFFVDNDVHKWGGICEGYEIKNPEEIKKLKQYDCIALGTLMGLSEVQEQLMTYGVPKEKINKTYVEISVISRIMFLKRFAEFVDKRDFQGSVAEAGVFRGEFAKEINRYFSNRRCYLFDTFEGFDERDFAYEQEDSMTEEAKHLKMTSENLVYEKMPYKNNVIIRKGYFPDTTNGIEDIFLFVNLDMDLYHPILEGLKFFYPRMVNGGIILVHDYFTEIFPNVEKAVADFEKEIGIVLKKAPIGDDITLMIIK